MIVETPALDDQVKRLFAADPELLLDPYAVYARLRREAPVHWLDPTTVVLTRHADVKAVHRDHRRYHNAQARGMLFEDRLSLLSPADVELYHELVAFEQHRMSRKNGDEHARVRGVAQHLFTPKSVSELRPFIDELLDDLLRTTFAEDVVDAMQFAYQLPLYVVHHMFGISRADSKQVKAWDDQQNSYLQRNPLDAALIQTARSGLAEQCTHISRLFEEWRGDPGRTALVEAMLGAAKRGQCTEDELITMVTHISSAGHETTTNLIGNGLCSLLLQRDQWELLCEDPAALSKLALEELLRRDTPTQFIPKLAAVETEIGGVPIPTGTIIATGLASANRDEEVFEDPDRLDITRWPNDHLAFGIGVHFCLGAPVLRLEGQLALEALATRFPDMELAVAPEKLRRRHGFPQYGLLELPVRLNRGGRS